MRINLINMIFPTVCPYCDNIIDFDNKNGFCGNCASKVSFADSHRFITKSDKLYVNCISSFKYQNEVKSSIHRFKFKSKRNYRHMFGRSMFKTFISYANLDAKNFDIITFVPFSRKQKQNRSYNHSHLLAKSFAQNLNIPCKALISKVRDNKSQHELNAIERAQNVKGVYGIIKTSTVTGKNIILCDDIVTTGSTLKENVNQLINNGAKSIICITLADARV